MTCRADDEEVLEVLETIDHGPSRRICEAERQLLAALGGGCQTPVGALASERDGQLHLRGSVSHPDGEERLEGDWTGAPDEAEQGASSLAEALLEQGAGAWIDA